jgi:hypothetical protein
MTARPRTEKLSRDKEATQNEKQINAHPTELCNPMIPRNQAERGCVIGHYPTDRDSAEEV